MPMNQVTTSTLMACVFHVKALSALTRTSNSDSETPRAMAGRMPSKLLYRTGPHVDCILYSGASMMYLPYVIWNTMSQK